MSTKKGSKEVLPNIPLDNMDNTPQASPVDFIFRTMIQRAGAPGKRQIRPKNVEELLQSDIQELGSDEDPDFDISKDKHHNESDLSIGSDDEDDEIHRNSNDDDNSDDNEGKAEDDDSDEDDDSYDANMDKEKASSDSEEGEGSSSSSEDSEVETDSQSPVQKKSALRETLKKLNEAEFTPQANKRRRKKPKKVATISAPGGSSTSNSKGGKSSAKDKEKESSGGQTCKKSDGPSSSAKKKSQAKGKTTSNNETNERKSKTEDSSCKTSGKRNASSSGGGSNKKKGGTSSSKSKTKQSELTKDKDEGKTKKKKKKRNSDAQNQKSISEMVDKMQKSQKENRKEIDLGNPICSACLGRNSDGMNEIVECDSCGITVHEGCYGVSDTLSVSSGSGSSCSTEPWFCDACKTGSKCVISCELCPMEGGLFKETTGGRWVHLVCALYTPGVVIMEIGLPSLFEIPYSKYGSHPCSVCEDVRYSRTGICIPCDAGMCKTYLHATCAQKHGLLSDPVIHTEVEADPYYAACKLHTNRETSKRRGKSYGILQEQLRIKKEQKLSENLTPHQRYNQTRIRRKLERIRFRVAIKQAHAFTRYANNSLPFGGMSANSASFGGNDNPISSPLSSLPTQNQLPAFGLGSALGTDGQGQGQTGNTNLPPSWREGQVKKTRLLSTSAAAARAFRRKAELMGLDMKSFELEEKNERIVTSVTRKWNVLPGLSVEFAAYYADREIRISNLSDQYLKLEKENDELNEQQFDLQDAFDCHSVNSQLMTEDTDKMREKLIDLSEMLKGICPPSNKKLIGSLNGILPKMESGSGRRRSPSHSSPKGGGGKSPKGSSASKKNKKGSKGVLLSPSLPLSTERLSIKVCSVCSRSEEQPWIIRCDHCNKFYHLKCLDPPLTRIPKRSRLCGWMCSDCGEEELEGEEAEVDTEAPRTLRGRTKIRKPGKYRNSTDSKEDEVKLLGAGIDIEKRTPIVLLNPVQLNQTQMKTEAVSPQESPLLTNGNVKSSMRRRSGNSLNASSSLSSPPLVSIPEEADVTPTTSTSTPHVSSKHNSNSSVEAKKELFISPITKTSPASAATKVAVKSAPPNVNLVEGATKPKKPRRASKSPQKNPSEVKEGDLPPATEGSDTRAPKGKKSRPPKVKKEVDSSPLGSPACAKKAKLVLTPQNRTENLAGSENATVVVGGEITPKATSTKRKGAKKSEGSSSEIKAETLKTKGKANGEEGEGAEGEVEKGKGKKAQTPTTEGSEGGAVGRWPKGGKAKKVSAQGAKSKKGTEGEGSPKSRKKKSDAANKKALKVEDGEGAETRGGKKPKGKKAGAKKVLPLNMPMSDLEKEQNMIGIGSSMMAVAVEVKKIEEGVSALNGSIKLGGNKKRKSSATVPLPLGCPLGGGGGNVRTPVTMPPKKRKRVASTPQELTNQEAVIDAVAQGNFLSPFQEDNLNGLPPSPLNNQKESGVIMQGKAEWRDADDQRIMKGEAMGGNSEEIVTVKTSDLIDYVINSACTSSATLANYSPGFYSTSNNLAGGEGTPKITIPTCSQGGAKGNTNSESNKQDGLLISPPRNLPNSSTQRWSGGEGESQNQNVIKLHYDQSPANPPVIPPPPPPSVESEESPQASPVKHKQPLSVAPYSAGANTYTAPPPGSGGSGNMSKCAACAKDETKRNMVTCDKCAQEFHFMCLKPPMKYSPRRRGYSWYCSGCDDEETTASGQENGLSSP